MSPIVSVIVTMHNVEKYIGKGIDSILEQTYTDFELIIIDDGSEDESGLICDEFALKDARVRVIHQENQGIASARNHGIQAAKGTYILFVDGDDTVHKDMLEDAVFTAQKYSADIVMFNYQAVDEAGNVLYQSPYNLPDNQPFALEEIPEVLLNPVSVWSKLVHRSLYDDIIIPSGIWYEDLWIAPRLYQRASKMVYLNKKPLYNYLIRNDSIMRTLNFDKMQQDRVFVLDALYSYFESENIKNKYYHELEALNTLHGFFWASMEVLAVDVDKDRLNQFRDFIQKRFPDFKSNMYIKQLSHKERFQFWLLTHRQYDVIWSLSRLSQWLRKKR